jgi:hypothetical protein
VVRWLCRASARRPRRSGAPEKRAGLLLGGVRAAANVPTDQASDSDPVQLARDTWIPAGLWKIAFITVALLCLWKGVQVLVS